MLSSAVGQHPVLVTADPLLMVPAVDHKAGVEAISVLATASTLALALAAAAACQVAVIQEFHHAVSAGEEGMAYCTKQTEKMSKARNYTLDQTISTN